MSRGQEAYAVVAGYQRTTAVTACLIQGGLAEQLQ